ncbi:MAG: hypothetical protein GY754_11480 [bacterium]|nr:hypothetical protein [bacterium]
MFLIKPCPSCGKKLRFPVDKGKVRVKCVCGHSFIADPDDTSIYSDSKFDIKDKKAKQGPSLFDSLSAKISGINFDDIKKKLITEFLETKYKLQNFKLLPVSEQRVVLFKVFAAAVVGLGLIMLLRML